MQPLSARLGLIAASLLAGSCAFPADAPASGDAAVTSLQQGAPAIIETRLRAADAVHDGPYGLAFWVDESYTGAAFPDGIEGHPCGLVARLSVSAIPDFPATGAYSAELAEAYDAQGRVERGWRAPVDYFPIGLDGESLLIEIAGGEPGLNQFWIDRQGRLSRPATPATYAHGAAYSCPVLGDTDSYCLAIRDAGTGAVHVLAADGVCT